MRECAQARSSAICLVLVAFVSVACGAGSSAPDGGGGTSQNRQVSEGAGGSQSDPPDELPNLSIAGSGGTGTAADIDCSFAELDVCVTAAVDEALGCLQAGRVGTFAGDRLSCSFREAGGVATFSEPFPSSYNGFQLSLELSVADEPCVSYVDALLTGPNPSALELQTRSHTVKLALGPERTLECDGVSKTFSVQDVATCGARMPSPELSKNVLLGAAEVFFFRPGGMSFLFKCDASD
jgi:hypothetical protein